MTKLSLGVLSVVCVLCSNAVVESFSVGGADRAKSVFDGVKNVMEMSADDDAGEDSETGDGIMNRYSR